MKLLGFLIIFGCLFVGEILIFLTHLPLPPSIIGLLLLFGLLQSGLVKLQMVQDLAKTMMDYLAFMVASACISIMQYLDILSGEWVAIVFGTALSTLLVILVTGYSHRLVRSYLKTNSKKQGASDE